MRATRRGGGGGRMLVEVADHLHRILSTGLAHRALSLPYYHHPPMRFLFATHDYNNNSVAIVFVCTAPAQFPSRVFIFCIVQPSFSSPTNRHTRMPQLAPA